VVGAVASLALRVGVADAAPIKVACVGEQTTFTGHYAANLQWPSLLGAMLGSGYVVENDGDNNGGAILQDRTSGAPVPKDYSDCGTYMNPNSTKASTKTAYTNSINAPDVVVIGSWGKHDERFASDAMITIDQARFQEDFDLLVAKYLSLPKKPVVILTTPIELNDTPATVALIRNAVLPAVKAVASNRGLPLIDTNSIFKADPALTVIDGGLSTPGGQTKMALLVYQAVIGIMGTTADSGAPDSRTDASPADASRIDDAGISTGGAGGTTTGAAGGTGMSGAGGTDVATTGTAGTGSAAAGGASSGRTTTVTAGTTTVTAGTGGGATNPSAPADSGGGCAIAGGESTGGPATLLGIVALLRLARRRRTGV